MLRSDWQVAPFEPSLCGPIGITDGVAGMAQVPRTQPVQRMAPQVVIH